MSEEVYSSELNALLIPVQKAQKKLNVSYLETGIDQHHIWKQKQGELLTLGFGLQIFSKSWFYMAQKRTDILDQISC